MPLHNRFLGIDGGINCMNLQANFHRCFLGKKGSMQAVSAAAEKFPLTVNHATEPTFKDTA